jgi:hypothetical protein
VWLQQSKGNREKGGGGNCKAKGGQTVGPETVGKDHAYIS